MWIRHIVFFAKQWCNLPYGAQWSIDACRGATHSYFQSNSFLKVQFLASYAFAYVTTLYALAVRFSATLFVQNHLWKLQNSAVDNNMFTNVTLFTNWVKDTYFISSISERCVVTGHHSSTLVPKLNVSLTGQTMGPSHFKFAKHWPLFQLRLQLFSRQFPFDRAKNFKDIKDNTPPTMAQSTSWLWGPNRGRAPVRDSLPITPRFSGLLKKGLGKDSNLSLSHIGFRHSSWSIKN